MITLWRGHYFGVGIGIGIGVLVFGLVIFSDRCKFGGGGGGYGGELVLFVFYISKKARGQKQTNASEAH